MTFDLTDELTSEIISAMENQNEVFFFDAERKVLVPASNPFEDGTSSDEANEDRFYRLPEWRPSDGFSVREDFVYSLHAPIVREKLQDVLHSGRGVFKNFRIVLQDYPEIDKRWHIYKYKVMSNRVNEWYNSLREIWGLEKLDQVLEVEDSLLYDDFSFNEYNSSLDKETILFNISSSNNDDEKLPSEVSDVIFNLWLECFKEAEKTGQIGYVCKSLSDDFAGCITASSIMKNQEKILVITSLFVPEQFRGLGICTELINLCISKIEKSGKNWIIMPNYIVSELLEPLLIRTGFMKFSSGYFLAVQQKDFLQEF